MTHIREGIFTMGCFQVFTTEERVTQEKIPGKFFFQESYMDGSQYFRFVIFCLDFSLIA